MPDCLDDAGPVLKGLLSPGQQPIFRHGSIPESSEKTLHALLMTQISKEDYTDFLDFSIKFVSV
jgi:hypothetical protein